MLETTWESRWLPDPWGYSSVGRAPALQAGGQGFESLYLHVDSEESSYQHLFLENRIMNLIFIIFCKEDIQDIRGMISQEIMKIQA